jgi:hypothetical protein
MKQKISALRKQTIDVKYHIDLANYHARQALRLAVGQLGLFGLLELVIADTERMSKTAEDCLRKYDEDLATAALRRKRLENRKCHALKQPKSPVPRLPTGLER